MTPQNPGHFFALFRLHHAAMEQAFRREKLKSKAISYFTVVTGLISTASTLRTVVTDLGNEKKTADKFLQIMRAVPGQSDRPE
ncbi:unnamed protein product [Linum tenue]|uniref:Transposase n=1 Tax=Linum tenue TaxID=586396 RepID=A0AAV0NN87_9ROSI|nr:unnamed protein product [Linum tenue]